MALWSWRRAIGLYLALGLAAVGTHSDAATTAISLHATKTSSPVLWRLSPMPTRAHSGQARFLRAKTQPLGAPRSRPGTAAPSAYLLAPQI